MAVLKSQKANMNDEYLQLGTLAQEQVDNK
jgi:hypothetical protein